MKNDNENHYLLDSLQKQMDESINLFYDTVNKNIIIYASRGYSSVILFLPLAKNLKTINEYNGIIYDLHYNLDDAQFCNKLVTKFKSQGIKLNILRAVESIQYGYYYNTIRYCGYIIKLKWDKDYSKNCCAIL
ncbi:putative ORFan [Tupanvirus deep ocean]|uniref:ORFan n=2 Tax=Tupanvirus TaxID=2094720 RepID=A0AC62A754_9VIRU|nr:putative ORFan [Tupanvirus deep ocean]QKU33561.1 putative ORFan [Tupanvirus deep ocean]